MAGPAAEPDRMEKDMKETDIQSEFRFADIVGESEALRRVLDDIDTVAPVDSTVLIYGERNGASDQLVELLARSTSQLQAGSPA